MKLAKIADIKRGIDKRVAADAPQVVQLSVENLGGFADVSLAPKSAFLTICGGTGMGKTALLYAIHAALTAGTDGEPSLRVAGAHVKIDIDYAGEHYKQAITLGAAGALTGVYPRGVHIVDLVKRTLEPQAYFLDKDVNVLKEGLGPTAFDQETLEAVSMICRKDYDEIIVYEVEAEADRTVPLFEVLESGTRYDNRSMATGEVSAFSLAWALRSAGPGSIVLIEEPEAYLPPVGHPPAFALIAQAALKRKLGIILTTHSPFIASGAPEHGLISIWKRSNLSVIPAGRTSKLRTLSRLGLAPQIKVVLLVEDDLAVVILKEILAMYELPAICDFEVLNAKSGDGGVKKALESLPVELRTCRFLGFLDGDQRSAVRRWKSKDRILFLPFRATPEKELLAAIASDVVRFSKGIGRDYGRVESALSDSKGSDPHDRFKALAGDLSLSVETLAQKAFHHWLKAKPGRRTEVRTLMRGLAKKLKVDLPGN